MRWVTSFAPSPLPVFGPGGTEALLRATEAMLEPDIGYRLAHHDELQWRPSSVVNEVNRGVIFDEESVRVTAAPTDHAPVPPTVAFRIDDGSESVVIAGDTVPCPGLDELCSGADVLVHTVVRRDLIEGIGLPRLTDVLDYHSSVPGSPAFASLPHTHGFVVGARGSKVTLSAVWEIWWSRLCRSWRGCRRRRRRSVPSRPVV
jgi:ribonuclease Z